MTLVKKHQTALQRQIHEALNIEGSRADIVLNKKCEWNGSRIPRLRVEVGDKLNEEEICPRNKVKQSGSKRIKKSDQKKRKNEDDRTKPEKRFRFCEDNLAEDNPTQHDIQVVNYNNNNENIFLDKTEDDDELAGDSTANKVQVDIDSTSKKETEENTIREVEIIGRIVPFVDHFRYQEDVWTEEDLIVETAARLDREERDESVAEAKRPFWAKEIILDDLMKRIDLRKDLRNWSRVILRRTLERVPQISMIKNVIRDIADSLVEEKEKVASTEEILRKKTKEKENLKSEVMKQVVNDVLDEERKRKRDYTNEKYIPNKKKKKEDKNEKEEEKKFQEAGITPGCKTPTYRTINEKDVRKKTREGWRKIWEGGGGKPLTNY